MFPTWKKSNDQSSSPTCVAKLSITCRGGRNLRKTQIIGAQDPYCELYIKGPGESSKAKKTKVHTNGGKTPQWNDHFEFDVQRLDGAMLVITVKNQNMTSDATIGSMELAVSTISAYSSADWYKIYHGRKEAGELHLDLRLKRDHSSLAEAGRNLLVQANTGGFGQSSNPLMPTAANAGYAQAPAFAAAQPLAGRPGGSLANYRPSNVPPSGGLANYRPMAAAGAPVASPAPTAPAFGAQQPAYGVPQQQAPSFPAQQPAYVVPQQQLGSKFPAQQPAYGAPQLVSKFAAQQPAYIASQQQPGPGTAAQQPVYGAPRQNTQMPGSLMPAYPQQNLAFEQPTMGVPATFGLPNQGPGKAFSQQSVAPNQGPGQAFSPQSIAPSAPPAQQTVPASAGGSSLPPGWEEGVDATGKVFYIDHINQRTQWERPDDVPPPYQP